MTRMLPINKRIYNTQDPAWEFSERFLDLKRYSDSQYTLNEHRDLTEETLGGGGGGGDRLNCSQVMHIIGLIALSIFTLVIFIIREVNRHVVLLNRVNLTPHSSYGVIRINIKDYEDGVTQIRGSETLLV